MLHYRGARYVPVRKASVESLTVAIQSILTMYGKAYEAELRSLDPKQQQNEKLIQALSYRFSKAVASELNAVVQLEYEVNANLFGTAYLNDFDTEWENTLCQLQVESVLPISDLLYCPRMQLELCERCGRGWNKPAEDIASSVHEAIEDTEIEDPAMAFLNAMVQHTYDLGFRAAPTVRPDKLIKIRIGGTFVEMKRLDEDTVYLAFFVAYEAKGGWGSRVLKLITDIADTFCVDIKLLASPMQEFDYIPEFKPRKPGEQMKLRKLVEFYSRFGFATVDNRGYSVHMNRQPNCQLN